MPETESSPVARTAYIVFVAGLAAALALTGSTAVAPWLLLILLTAPTSVLAVPAALVLLMVGVLVDGPALSAAVVVLWTGLWAVIAAVNAPLVDGGARADAWRARRRAYAPRSPAGHPPALPSASCMPTPTT